MVTWGGSCRRAAGAMQEASLLQNASKGMQTDRTRFVAPGRRKFAGKFHEISKGFRIRAGISVVRRIQDHRVPRHRNGLHDGSRRRGRKRLVAVEQYGVGVFKEGRRNFVATAAFDPQPGKVHGGPGRRQSPCCSGCTSLPWNDGIAAHKRGTRALCGSVQIWIL